MSDAFKHKNTEALETEKKQSEWNISDYKFVSLEGHPEVELGFNISSYEVKSLDGKIKQDQIQLQPAIRRERAEAKKSFFKVSEIVSHHRGLKKQEEEDSEKRIQEEISQRLEKLKQEAYEEGYQKGLEMGSEAAKKEVFSTAEKKIEVLNKLLDIVSKKEEEIFKQQKQSVYDLVKSLTKWIILRELKEDGTYINRLLEKIILELNTRTNLIFHVREEMFSDMPEILDILESKVGSLANVRIEVDQEQDSRGIVVESDKGILDGSLSAQFEILDKLFEKVAIDE